MTYIKPIAALVAVGSLLATGPLALAAGAAATPEGGAITIYIHNTSETKGKITITGAIGDYGTSLSEDKSGKADPNGNYEKIDLKKGSFLVDGTKLNKALQHVKPQINASTCSVVFTGTGPVTIGSGTGAYEGISGTRVDHDHVRGDRPQAGVEVRAGQGALGAVQLGHRHGARLLRQLTPAPAAPVRAAGAGGVRDRNPVRGGERQRHGGPIGWSRSPTA